VRLAEIPRFVANAVVAIEDERFYEHAGIDLQAILRAALRNVGEGGVAEGGSTITQQYVKNVLLEPDRTLKRKVREAALALQLEDRFTKDRILELYLNTIYFGNGAYGIEAAAREYFATSAAELTLAHAATLAGLIRAPAASDPYGNPDAAVARRNVVLDKMVELGAATVAEASAASDEDLGLAVRDESDRYLAGHFVEQVKRFVLDDPRFGETREEREALLFTGGLRIHTTIDLQMQADAEAAIARVLSEPESDPEAALAAIEPNTGFVRALVGGRDFFGTADHAKFDLASQKGRPAGSSFKPLVLGAAIEKGFPLDVPYSAPSTIRIPLETGAWTVSNYGGANGGRPDLVEATVRSYNTTFAQLMMQVGPADAVAFANRVGIKSPLAVVPSTVLGVNDVTPLEMSSAFGTFANRGIHLEPTFVEEILRPDGTILYQHERSPRRAVDRSVADQLTAVLRQVIERGTGTRARIGRPAAGKTGTGQDWTDAWFVGFTPNLATAVWIGFPEGQISMTPPRTRITVTGGSWPAQIWQLFMSAALADEPVIPFATPTDDVGAPLGPPRPLPDVTRLPLAEATLRLKREGWQVTVQRVPSLDFPPGIVIEQSPDPGEEHAVGDVVVLDVSEDSPELATVPAVLGQTTSTAVAALEDAGFTPVIKTEAEPGGGAELRQGRVWKQSPAGSTELAVGSTVTIWVNPEPPPTTPTTEDKDNGKGNGPP